MLIHKCYSVPDVRAMVTPVVVVAALTQCVSVHTTLKVTLVIAACRCTMTSHGNMGKRTMPIPARCVIAMAMQSPATTMPQWTHFQRAMIREEVEYVTTVREILVSFNDKSLLHCNHILQTHICSDIHACILTAGQHCENCAFAYYRPSGVSANDSNPCVPCDCDTRGDTNNGDCVKVYQHTKCYCCLYIRQPAVTSEKHILLQSEGIPGQVVGQCQCKANVIGTRCDECRGGFFALSASNPQGCSTCNCNTDGTVMASDTCHATSGQCVCKENVMGLKCDQCINGTTQLSALNENGCTACACNSDGSMSSICDGITGACDCKPGVGGTRCDECLDGYFDFSDTGCELCTCDTSGSVSNACDKETGACSCRPNVEGDICDTCSSGYYNLSAGCIECGCTTDGTVNSNIACHEENGQCQCKENIQGRTCDTCMSGFTALTASNIVGCAECNCSEFGTNHSGSVCDPVTSQCECLQSATGYRCENCVAGYYATAEGCVQCECDPNGSSSNVCDADNGVCPCNVGVGGEQCNFCLSGFFQFPRYNALLLYFIKALRAL